MKIKHILVLAPLFFAGVFFLVHQYRGVIPSAEMVLQTHTPKSLAAGEILFTARPDGIDHIYLMKADGTDIRQLTSGPDRDTTPEWSFDGKKIVFQREHDGPSIYTMNADGSDVKRISAVPGRDLLPAWSPDGSKIIFTRVIVPPTDNAGVELAVTAIMEMKGDGTDAREIYSDGGFNMEPRYSPDGTKIAFMCGKPGIGIQVCLINSDGSGLEKLTSGLVVHGDPHWSHDGKRIAFGSNREGKGRVNIFVVNPDGSGLRQITDFPAGKEAGDVGWSPDDSKMTFELGFNSASQSRPDARAEIWIMNADGSDQYSTSVSCSSVGCAPRFKP